MNEYRWQDLKVGLSVDFEADITNEMMNDFARISGDTNPLHLEDDFARSAGFQSRVVYGLLTSSLYSRLVGVYLPGKYGVLHGLDVQFLSPSYVGDHLSVSGEVSYLNDVYRQIEIRAKIRRDSVSISRAKIRAGMHES